MASGGAIDSNDALLAAWRIFVNYWETKMACVNQSSNVGHNIDCRRLLAHSPHFPLAANSFACSKRRDGWARRLVLATTILVGSLATIASAPAFADEDPIELPPIVVNPPFIICKIADGDTKPGNENDEQPSAKCSGGGGPPLPGGGGSGGGGGGGGSSGIIPIPNNPNNQNSAASCDTPELAVPYANAEVGPFMLQLDVGDRVLIQYLNGQTEIFEIICKFCTITVAPVPGTCS